MSARRTSGPPPKENRRRRNADPYAGLEVAVSAASTASAPALPRAEGYLSQTCDWYATWAASPQAQTFTMTDWQRLHMLAPIVDRYFHEPTISLMAEIRLNESLLGATHADRLRARMKVEKPPAAEVPPGVTAIQTYRDRLTG